MTLIEKIAVALIIGILSSITLPSWLGFASAQEVKVSGDKVEAAIKAAQSEAKLKKLMSDYLLRVCRTDTTCELADQLDSAMMSELEAQMPGSSSELHSSHAVKFHNYLQSINPATLHDLILPALLPILDQSALIQDGQLAIPASSSQPLSGTLGGKQTKGAIEAGDRNHSVTAGSDDKATKKPKKSTLAVEGCFRNNGQFLLRTAAGWSEVNWTTIPANTTIKTSSPLCTSINVN